MKNKKLQALMATTILTSVTSTAFAMTISEKALFDSQAQTASDIAVYKNYVANPEDGEMADLAKRVYFKMTAPQYFKRGNSLAWKDENASYWK